MKFLFLHMPVAPGWFDYCADLATALTNAGHTVRQLPLPTHAPADTPAQAPGVLQIREAIQTALNEAAPTPTDHDSVLVVQDALLATLPTAYAHRAVGVILQPDLPPAQALAGLRMVVVASEALASRLRDVQPDLHVIVPGTPLRDHLPTQPAPPLYDAHPPLCRILAVGECIPRKGHDMLIEALAKLTDLEWRLTIVSPDPAHEPEYRKLVDLIAARKLQDRVQMKDATHLEQSWQQADLFALATRWEGYPEAVAEAMRRGIPLALTAGGQADALVPQTAGIVCAPDDMEGFSKAMRRVIFDAHLRHDMAQAARASGANLPQWAQQAEKFTAALSALAAPATGANPPAGA